MYVLRLLLPGLGRSVGTGRYEVFAFAFAIANQTRNTVGKEIVDGAQSQGRLAE